MGWTTGRPRWAWSRPDTVTSLKHHAASLPPGHGDRQGSLVPCRVAGGRTGRARLTARHEIPTVLYIYATVCPIARHRAPRCQTARGCRP
ncbi:hypothetical protein PAI11_23580 [Patulibacter medicamentivorans]|uniref:Uncharacterized protein n=1 Tax=Patulibacter medicamentivorans TaxID=1097667 RepID=H0E6A8_9ACTN|nr:hypothetical protein PAI11_23580 [Patulibacter medicamentivorans]